MQSVKYLTDLIVNGHVFVLAVVVFLLYIIYIFIIIVDILLLYFSFKFPPDEIVLHLKSPFHITTMISTMTNRPDFIADVVRHRVSETY